MIYMVIIHGRYKEAPMSKATITLPRELLNELMYLLHAKSKTETVMKAVLEEIRRKKVERVQSVAGSMEFVRSAEKLRHGDERLG